MKRKILIGDVLEQLKNVPDSSIDTIVTSPPYWGLRDYGAEGQWGLERDFHDYLDKLDLVMNECWRILKPTGSVWINLGDTYSTVSGGMKDLKRGVKKKYGKVNYGVGNAKTGDKDKQKADAYSVDQDKMYKGLQSKSRVGIPERFYIRCIDNGWIARNHIPWIKANSMPSSVRDRFTNKWESVFFFVKQKKYYFDLDNVRVPPKTGFDAKPFNRRIREAKRLKQMGLDGAIVGATMSDGEEKNTDKNGNRKSLEVLRQKENMVKHGFAAKHDYGLHERREKGEEVSNCHPLGKNPGDVFMEKTENIVHQTSSQQMEKTENTESMENYDADEFKEEVENLKKNVYGKDKANRSRVLAFLNTKKESSTNPLGKNPGDVFYDKSKPYAVQERDGVIAFRSLPPHDEIREYLTKARKNVKMTIKTLEDKLGKTCHHWFERQETPRSTSSFPTSNDWKALKEILGFDDKYDIQMQTFLYKNAEKVNNVKGKNPGDVFKEFQENVFDTLKLEKVGKRIKLSDIEETDVGEPLENRKYAKVEKATILGQRKSLNERMNKARELGSGHDTGLNNPLGKNPGDVFNGNEGEADIFEINTRPFAKAHFATFPPALPEKILKASCPKEVCKKCGKPREPITEIIGQAEKKITGYNECSCKAGFEAGTVLDPFFGAGTVGVVAEELHLNWIGIELKQEYADIAIERLKPYMEQHKIGDK